MTIEIRPERDADMDAIREVNRLAFGQNQEAALVDALRSNGASLLSLVATSNGGVVGHIMYSPALVQGRGGAALGPMAVRPDHQRRGIGTALVDAGNRQLRAAGYPFIVVVGHPEFYPRFGFRPASGHGIACEWDVPDEVFMVLVLDGPTMSGVSGLAKYRAEFALVADDAH
ncbi:MAG TPA: N-acetyltransferase [Vicinamibacterales bacterium]|nr:N-acetyltransferase [Vicinamibacterales bacterium]